MRGKKAKVIRKAAKALCTAEVPDLKYKHTMLPMKIFIDPMKVKQFQNVQYFHGSPYILTQYPQWSLGMCACKVYQDLKKHVKTYGWSMPTEARKQGVSA